MAAARQRIAASIRSLLSEPSATIAPSAAEIIRQPSSPPSPAAWRDYLLARGWLCSEAFNAADAPTQHAALRALSAALTYPLTVARAWSRLALPTDEAVRICIVGARAEASMPMHMWAELPLLTGASNIALECSGPASAPAGVSAERSWSSPSGAQRLSMSLGEADLFHRSATGRALLDRARRGLASAPPLAAEALPDAYVLFNPGFGEPGWERAWTPTLAALHAAERPLLLTALSAADAARDAAFLAGMGERAPGLAATADAPYADNPFGSLLGDGSDLGSAKVDAAPPGGTDATAAASPPDTPATTTPAQAVGGGPGGATAANARFYISSRPSNTHVRVATADVVS